MFSLLIIEHFRESFLPNERLMRISTGSLEIVHVVVSMATELDDHTPILSPIEHWYNVPIVF